MKERPKRTREIRKIMHQGDGTKALNYALKLLEYRARSTYEIKDRLLRKGYEQETIDFVVAKLKDIGLLDDVAFTKNLINDRIHNKNYGKKRIQAELTSRGICAELIEEELSNYKEEDETKRALSLARRRLPRYYGLDFVAAYRRLSQFLLRRGFSHATVREICTELLKSFPAKPRTFPP
ncbi:MAG: regulatory protein RecX [Actinomycetota bacterium]|nr:regulatory protein RecX [Actinomycetota bacterium]MDI6822066.1 regulatory protein RecX [Actinomycetota bacterium]